jgi:hypothetical protein
MPQSDIQRRAAAIEHELAARTTRMANNLKGEFDQDDAHNVSDKTFHEMIRRNWSDPNWRISTAQRIGPVALYKAALDAFGRNLDGSPSIDSHPDAIAAEPRPSALQVPETKPDTNAAPSPPLPSVFPFQGPAAPRPQPVPVMPVPPQMPPIGP